MDRRRFAELLTGRRILPCVVFACAAMFSTSAAFAEDQESTQRLIDRVRAGAACVPVATWVDPASRQTIAADKLLRSVGKKRVVLLGEQHDLMEHHRWQLQMMIELYAVNPDIVLGFEMFPRRVQPVLDRWVDGELGVEEFLDEVRWLEVWHYDPDLYMPLFHFARMNRIPMVALNIDRDLMARVREKGWANIPEEERQGVSDPAPAAAEYVRMLATSFRHHAPDGNRDSAQGDISDAEKQAFARFVETQQLWDRAMADAIAGRVGPGRKVQLVAAMGSGHILNGFGVPHQLRAQGIKDVATLIPWSHRHDCSELDPGIADAVFGLATEEQRPDAKPQLGILMEQKDAGITVVEVMEDSVAAAAGLEAGDVVTEIAGQPAGALQDVIEIVRGMVPGTWLPVTVQRGAERLTLVARFPPDIGE